MKIKACLHQCRQRMVWLIVWIVGAAALEPAVAQDAGEPGSDTDGLEEVVVTAQKRAERLIDTPQSVSVLTADTLTKVGATQFRDFADSVPGLSFQTTGAGSTQVTLRGVTVGFDVSPAVGVYVDEVPYGSSSAFALGAQQALDVGLFDVERIEVLRGPQGTLYGASTMGGLIKYVNKRPDASRFGVEARVGIAGTQDGGVSYNSALAVNAPIGGDKAALRTSAFYSHDGGYIDNVALDDSNADAGRIYGGRADLLITPTDALDIRIGAFAQNVSRDGQSTIEFTPAGRPQFGSLEQFRRFAETSDQRFRLVSGTVTYDFGPAALTSISSYQTAESEGAWDISAAFLPLLQAPPLSRSLSAIRYPQETRTYKFTQEVRLASPASRPLEWIIGGFYTRETSRWDEEFQLFDETGSPTVNDLYTFGAPSRFKEYAGFGDLTWHVTDRFNITGGVRYANNKQEFTQFGSGLFLSNRPTGQSDESVKTYLANARYHLSDRTMAYVRYATGYRPGGPNAAANDVNGNPLGEPTFEADRLKSYELGFKRESSDRRFVVDVAVYDIDWENMQLLTSIGGFAFRVNGAGGASIHGAELSLAVQPASAYRITGSIAWQDAELSAAEPALGPPGTGAREGERLPHVPRLSGALNVDYELPFGSWEPTLGATVRYMDERTTGFGAGAHELPEYTTVDLRAGVTLASLSAQLYIRNATDERGQSSLMLPQFGTRVAIIQPLTIGVALTKQF